MHADRHGTPAGIALLVLDALVFVVAYVAALGVFAPLVVRALFARVRARLRR